MISILGVLIISRVFKYPLDLISFFESLWLLTFLAGYFNHLPNTIRLYGKAALSVKRVAKFLSEQEHEEFIQSASIEEEPLSGRVFPKKIIFDQVSFKYPNGKKAIENLSIDMDLSKKIAIIGEVGSGKTTFLKLLCGELAPSEGQIRIEFEGGQCRNLWTRPTYNQYRDSIAYVPQEPFVSNDFLSMNIALTSGHHESEIIDAAYWAELEADISALPQGISQELGESGVNLSGGQRQRLNLARARFSKRKYLVLDDTLSALDTKTEASLMKRLESQELGFVLVTHRTGELMRVGEVVVMKEGKIVERGQPKILSDNPDSHFTRVLQTYQEESIQ